LSQCSYVPGCAPEYSVIWSKSVSLIHLLFFAYFMRSCIPTAFMRVHCVYIMWFFVCNMDMDAHVQNFKLGSQSVSWLYFL